MTKYNVGDKAKVREDLNMNESYYMENSIEHNSVVDEMLFLQGKEVTISKVEFIDEDMQYSIVEDNGEWHWTDEMFEG